MKDAELLIRRTVHELSSLVIDRLLSNNKLSSGDEEIILKLAKDKLQYAGYVIQIEKP